MQYQVLLQKPSAQHFVASIVGLPNVMADGKTEQEAIDKIKLALKAQLAAAKFVTIDVELDADAEEEDRERPLPKSIGTARSGYPNLSELVDAQLNHKPKQPRKPGLIEGSVGEAFFEPLPEEELRLWE